MLPIITELLYFSCEQFSTSQIWPWAAALCCSQQWMQAIRECTVVNDKIHRLMLVKWLATPEITSVQGSHYCQIQLEKNEEASFFSIYYQRRRKSSATTPTMLPIQS